MEDFFMKTYNQKKILVNYIIKKLKFRIKDINEQELEEYFEQKGWILYDIDTMTNKIKKWRRIKQKRKADCKN